LDKHDLALLKRQVNPLLEPLNQQLEGYIKAGR
jgi:hypothetical protein